MTKIDAHEKKLLKGGSYREYIGSSLKAYKKYRCAGIGGRGVSSHLKDNGELMSAVLRAQEGFNLHCACSGLLLLCAFLYMEVDALSDAKDIIDRIKPYRGYYKNNSREVYIVHTFLSARYDIKTLNNKGALRQVKKLEKLTDDFSALLLGQLYYDMGDYSKSLKHLEESYKKGGRSSLLYILYGSIPKNGEDSGLLFLPFIKWSHKEGLLEEGFAEKNEGLIRQLMADNLPRFKRLYDSTGSERLLSLICEEQIKRRDTGEDAYKYYKDLERRQLHVDGMAEMLIICACIYVDEAVPLHTMRSFLKKHKMDESTLPFVLHLLLAVDDLGGLIEEFGLGDLILKAGEWALENSLSGRIYNSIYRYFLEHSPEVSEKAGQFVYSDLFLANIYIEGCESGLLYVYEDELQNMAVYEFEGGFKQVRTIAGNVKIAAVDKSTGRIAEIKYTVKKQVENADAWLYRYYMIRGCNDPALYMALSGLYIKSNTPSEEYIDVLNKTLEISFLSTAFRMKVGGELGNILSVINRHDKALDYFNRVDERHLDQRYIGTMLVAFINAYDFKKAAQLIIKKREYISDRTLLWALKEIASDYRNSSMHKIIADAAYELLIKNWYDAKLLDIVIQYYAGSNEDWVLLRSALARVNLYNLLLDKKIIENSLRVRDFSEASQAVFVRLYANEKEKVLTGDYIYYACYEIIVLSKRPVYEFITNLEEYFENTGDRLAAYALSMVYLRYFIKTLKSHEILAKTIGFMEDAAVLLPEFKEVEELSSLHIEKHQPFIYKAAASSKVVLHYRIDGEGEYRQKTMTHLFFGVFSTAVPLFYNEKIEYYISEETGGALVKTEVSEAHNTKAGPGLEEGGLFSNINKALISEKAFKHTEVERIISELLKDGPKIRGQIL